MFVDYSASIYSGFPGVRPLLRQHLAQCAWSKQNTTEIEQRLSRWFDTPRHGSETNKIGWNIIIWTNPSQQLSYANKQLKINEADFIPVQQSRWKPGLGWTWMHDVPWPLMTCWHRSPMFDSLAFWEVSSRVPHTIGMNYLCLVHWSKTLATCNVMFFLLMFFYFSWTWWYQWISVEAQV